MSKLAAVHGMRMPERSKTRLHGTWYRAINRGLAATAWGRAHPEALPGPEDLDLVYWADLFRPRRSPRGAPKQLVSREDLKMAAYAFLRATVRAADAASLWDERGEPFGPVALLVNRMVTESARYMNDGPIVNADPRYAPGAYFQIQARFEEQLEKGPRVVIGHSLGSVIAYEGLCLNPHDVDTFITVGSPMATPQLIREPMLKRLNRRLNRAHDAPAPWPGVRRWVNFYAPADVWSVPIERLARVMHPDIVDVEVRHGDPRRFVETHKLTAYLEHAELCEEIARALEACA